MKKQLAPQTAADRAFVDALREVLGLDPLYSPRPRVPWWERWTRAGRQALYDPGRIRTPYDRLLARDSEDL